MRRKKINPTQAELSPKEREALLFIERYITQQRRSPSIRDIATNIRLSVSATSDLVQRLIEWGYLARRSEKRRVRNLRVKRPLSS